jgi:hypothetical protein
LKISKLQIQNLKKQTMGATTFTTTAKGTSMKDAFNEAVSLDEQEAQNNDHNDHDWGEEDYDEENEDDDFDFDDDEADSYSGTIATTEFVKDATADYQGSGKTLEKFIEDTLGSHDIETRECWGIEIKEGFYVFFGWAAY